MLSPSRRCRDHRTCNCCPRRVLGRNRRALYCASTRLRLRKAGALHPNTTPSFLHPRGRSIYPTSVMPHLKKTEIEHGTH